jgi:hypothetical protein
VHQERTQNTWLRSFLAILAKYLCAAYAGVRAFSSIGVQMELFISWSGKQSNKIAEVIREWIPCVIQAVQPYYTPNDIDKGQRWGAEISKKLESSKVGIIVLTPSNLNAPWLMFEAGALSKSFENASVCPLLFGVSPADIKGPLLQFQCSTFGETEVFKLLMSINSSLGENKLDDKTLSSTFEVFWPKLQESIDSIIAEPEEGEVLTTSRPDREILEEILKLSRKSAYTNVASKPQSALRMLLEKREPVTFDPETGVVTFWVDNSDVYDFSLDRLTSGAEVLDWFLQVNNKGWCTPEHLQSFLNCIEEISDLYFDSSAQGVFCHGGQNKSPDWATALENKK